MLQFKNEYIAIINSIGTKAVAIHFFAFINFEILEEWFLLFIVVLYTLVR
jgi:hypothetical protein